MLGILFQLYIGVNGTEQNFDLIENQVTELTNRKSILSMYPLHSTTYFSRFNSCFGPWFV